MSAHQVAATPTCSQFMLAEDSLRRRWQVRRPTRPSLRTVATAHVYITSHRVEVKRFYSFANTPRSAFPFTHVVSPGFAPSPAPVTPLPEIVPPEDIFPPPPSRTASSFHIRPSCQIPNTKRIPLFSPEVVFPPPSLFSPAVLAIFNFPEG